MKNFLILSLFIIVSFTLMSSSGCNDEREYDNTIAVKEQAATEKNQNSLFKNQPPVRLDWSLEREQINRRTKLWNDQNKVSYIYLVSYGRVMAFFPLKGKVSSVNSQITNPQQIVKGDVASYGLAVIDSPAEDGSYGTNGDGIFFFTTDGAYVEWSGEYMLSDKPFKLTTAPELVRQIK